MKTFFKSNWALIIIIVLALFFRFWQINTLPGGLFPDEAANGIDTLLMEQGQIQPFYERGNGREALFFYFEWLSASLFGKGPWQFHVVSATFGFFAVLAVYFLAKRLFGKNIALMSAFLMAVSSYATVVTRTAFRATTVPLITTLCVLFFVKFFQAKDSKTKYWSAGLAGAFFALGFYTYTSSRMMLPLIFGFLVLLSLGFRHELRWQFREFTKYKLVFAGAFFAVISWIASYFISHPGSFVGRSGQVSVFNPDLNGGDLVGTLLLVFKQTILAFFTAGDLNWRHNISGFSFLSPLISPLFAAALIFFTISFLRLLVQVWRKNIQEQTIHQALVGVWFWFMMVPEITTAEGIPHGLRLVGVIPPMFIMSGWGVAWIWRKLIQYNFFAAYKYYFLGIFLFTVFTYNFNLYFSVAASSPEYYYSFRSDLTQVSNYLNERNNKEQTYLSLDKFSVQTVEYLTSDYEQPYILLDPANTYQVALKSGDEVVFTQSTIFDSKKFVQFHPHAQLIMELKNQFGQLIMRVYKQP